MTTTVFYKEGDITYSVVNYFSSQLESFEKKEVRQGEVRCICGSLLYAHSIYKKTNLAGFFMPKVIGYDVSWKLVNLETEVPQKRDKIRKEFNDKILLRI